MSIFNNDEMAKLRDDVQTLQKQVQELRSVLGTVCERLTPAAPPPPTQETSQVLENKHDEGLSTPRSPEVNSPQASVTATEALQSEEATIWQKLSEKMDVLAERIDTAAYQEKIIRDMHQELLQLKKGMLEDLKKGYLADIINICERLGDTDRHVVPDAPDFDAHKAKRLVTNTYLYVRDHLADEYSVEYFEPTVGESYEPKAHRAIRVVETDEADKPGTIAECLAGGFRNTETGRVIRQARVAVYKQKTSIITPTV